MMRKIISAILGAAVGYSLFAAELGDFTFLMGLQSNLVAPILLCLLVTAMVAAFFIWIAVSLLGEIISDYKSQNLKTDKTMENFYKVGDKVLVKSREWYETSKDSDGRVECVGDTFMPQMEELCGKVGTIRREHLSRNGHILYKLYFKDVNPEQDCWFTYDMLEGKIVETDIKDLKIGDKVLLKSKEWYDKSRKTADGGITLSQYYFNPDMARYLGKVVHVIGKEYDYHRDFGYIKISEDGRCWDWTSEMIEGKLVSPEDASAALESVTFEKKDEPLFKNPDGTTNLLAKAAHILNGDRQADYSDPVENFETIAKIASILNGREETPETCVSVMMAVKLAREAFKHKEDNLIDLSAYAEIRNRIFEKKGGKA
ncbi:DUF6378 domain-containing protein [Bacteroides sedimenti]